MIGTCTDWMSLVVCAREFDRVCVKWALIVWDSIVVNESIWQHVQEWSLKYILNGLSYTNGTVKLDVRGI